MEAKQLCQWLSTRNDKLYQWMIDPQRIKHANAQILYLDTNAELLFGSQLSAMLGTAPNGFTAYMGVLNLPTANVISQRMNQFENTTPAGAQTNSTTHPKGPTEVVQDTLLLTVHLHDPSLDQLRSISSLIQSACTAMSDWHAKPSKHNVERNGPASKMLNNIFGGSSPPIQPDVPLGTSPPPRIEVEIVCSPNVPADLYLSISHIVKAINDHNLGPSGTGDGGLFYSKGRYLNITFEERTMTMSPDEPRAPAPMVQFDREVCVKCLSFPIRGIPSDIHPGLWLTGHSSAFHQTQVAGVESSFRVLPALLSDIKRESLIADQCDSNWEYIGIGPHSNKVMHQITGVENEYILNDFTNKKNLINATHQPDDEHKDDARIRIGRILERHDALDQSKCGRQHDDLIVGDETHVGPTSSDSMANDALIASVVMLDRTEDFMSALSTPFTLGGLMDLMMKCNPINGDVRVPTSLAPSSFKRQSSPVPTAAADATYPLLSRGFLPDASLSHDILKLHHSEVGSKMRHYLQSVADVYTAREGLKEIKDIRDYIPEFKTKQQIHTAVSDLIHLATIVTSLSFKNPLFTERVSLEDALQRLEPSVLTKSYFREVAAGTRTEKQAQLSYLRQELSAISVPDSTPSKLDASPSSTPMTMNKFNTLELAHLNNPDVEQLELSTKICEQLLSDFLATRIPREDFANQENEGSSVERPIITETLMKASIGHPASTGLSMLCLASHFLGGIPTLVTDRVMETLLTLYGPIAQIWLTKLVKSRLLVPLSDKPFNWYFRRSSMTLMKEVGEEQLSVEDMESSYVFSGMLPTMTRIVDMLESYTRGHPDNTLSLKPLAKWLNLFHGSGCELIPPAAKQKVSTLLEPDPSAKRPRIWFVIILGGVTLSEYYSLKHMSELRDMQLIVISSHVINPRSIVEEVMGNNGSVPSILPPRT